MADIVVINCFPAFTQTSGVRRLNFGRLYRALAKRHRITMLTVADFDAQFEEIEYSASLRELRFPKDQLWQNAYQALKQLGVQGELHGLAFSIAAADPACGLRCAAHELAATADIVIHETPYSAPIFSGGCKAREIYNAPQFGADQLAAIIQGPGCNVALLQLIRLEQSLVNRVRRIHAASYDDLTKFHLFYGASREKLAIGIHGFARIERPVPGAAPDQEESSRTARPRLLFIGANQRLHLEAALFLHDIAPSLDECDIVIAGGAAEALRGMDLPQNVILHPACSSAQQHELLARADVFVNPVAEYSGHDPQLPEVLASGLALVSTPEGVHGLGLVAGRHCEIAQRGAFVSSIRLVLDNSAYRERLQANGPDAAHAQFFWDNLIREFEHSMFASTEAAEIEKPLLLALNDYSVMEPDSGGKVRIRSLLSHTGCNVVLVTFGTGFRTQLIASDVLHVTVPKTKAHRDFETALNDKQPVSVNDIVAGLFAHENAVLAEIVSALAVRARMAVFEHPYMAPLLDGIHAVNPNLPIAYSAHNVEAKLKAGLLREHGLYGTLFPYVAELEQRIADRAALLICCTEDDAAHFTTTKAKIVVVPNGCTIPGRTQDLNMNPGMRRRMMRRAGFLGSGHGPNVEAAKFIVENLAPSFPDLTFEFIGGVCKSLPLPPAANVIYHGIVAEEKKSEIMGSWDIALNPVLAGGGSNLKLSDYFAHGLPVISTPVGARGFAIAEKNAGKVVELDAFAATLNAMLVSPVEVAILRKNALRYAVTSLAWPVITREFKASLHELMQRSVPAG